MDVSTKLHRCIITLRQYWTVIIFTFLFEKLKFRYSKNASKFVSTLINKVKTMRGFSENFNFISIRPLTVYFTQQNLNR